MIKVNPGTKEARAIIATFKDMKWRNKGTIYDAYRKPSFFKVSAWEDISRRAAKTTGYNNDLRVTSANCYHFSTIYSYTNAEGTFIVFDTPSYTKVVKLEEE